MSEGVTVFCTAYNHEKYIRKCLEGFVSQQVDFPYEVLVNDDASTDGTAAIIREFEEKYPNIIHGVYHKENSYSQGINIYQKHLFPLTHGKYIALCEGDDYWTDPEKIKLQYEGLEAHPECLMAVHQTLRIYEDGKSSGVTIPPVSMKTGVIGSEDFVLCKSAKGRFHLSSFMIRMDRLSEYFDNLPRFRKCVSFGDIPYQLYFGYFGPVYCVGKIMSHYRMGSKNGWSKTLAASGIEKQIAQYQQVKNMYEAYDEFTQQKFHSYCEFGKLAADFKILFCQGEYKQMLDKQYKEAFSNLPFRQKVGIVLRAYFPHIAKMLQDNRR